MRQIFAYALAGGLAVATAAKADPRAEEGARLVTAITAMSRGNWEDAGRIVAGIPDSSARIYLDWRRLRDGAGRFSEYRAFLRDHPDWPGLPLLKRAGERRITDGADPAQVIAYFGDQPPQTGTGAMRLAAVLRKTDQADAADDVLRQAFLTLELSQSERELFQSRYAKLTKPLTAARANEMLWQIEPGQARALIPNMSDADAALTQARAALLRGENGVNKLIDLVPENLQSDPGLAFARFRWRMRRDIWDGAEEMIRARSATREKLGRPEVWAGRRASLARKVMRDGRYKDAYEIARRHHLRFDEDGFLDLEWLSGFIALTYLENPDAAVTHFRRLRQRAVTPISQGRIWYWLGRAHAAAGNPEKAREAWEVGAKYQTSFYGQLAAEAANLPDDPGIAGVPMPNWQEAPFLVSSVFRAGMLLHHADQHYEAGRFFAHMAETMDQPSQAQLGQILLDLERPNMALRVAKNAARMGRVVINPYYPVTELAEIQNRVPPELVMAIARQETELNPNAQSPVGAVGLMQVMPRTAQAMAKAEGLAYDKSRLRTDWRYNATLGVAYLSELLERYDGSLLKVAAA